MISPEPEHETTEALLRRYRQGGSQAALRLLISRYLPLVYSAARWRTGSDTMAADVAQAVFCDFARQTQSLPVTIQLGGWLLRHAGYLASRALRTERRRAAREAEALRQTQLYESMNTHPSNHTALEAALQRLPARDQAILVLKYYEEQDVSDIAARLGVSTAAAQKRTERALLRLRKLMPGAPALPSVAGALAVSLSHESARACVPPALLPTLASSAVTAAAQPLHSSIVWMRHMGPWTGGVLGSAAALALAAVPLVSYAASLPAHAKADLSATAIAAARKAIPPSSTKTTGEPPTAASVVDELLRLVDREGYNRVAWNKAENLIPKIPRRQCGEAVVLLAKAFPVQVLHASDGGPARWIELLLWRWKPDSPGAALIYLLPNITPALRDGTALRLCQDWFRKKPDDAAAWWNELLTDTEHRLLPADCRAIVIKRLGYFILKDLASRDPDQAAATAHRMEEQGFMGLFPGLSNQRIITEGSSLAWDALSLPDHKWNQSLNGILKGDDSPAEKRRMADQISDPFIRRDMAPMLAREILHSEVLDPTESRRTAEWLMAQAPADRQAPWLRSIVRAWMEHDLPGLEAWLRESHPAAANAVDEERSRKVLRSNAGADASIEQALDIHDTALRDYTLAVLIAREQDLSAGGRPKVLDSSKLPAELSAALRQWLALPP